jgi:hypothetical protein
MSQILNEKLALFGYVGQLSKLFSSVRADFIGALRACASVRFWEWDCLAKLPSTRPKPLMMSGKNASGGLLSIKRPLMMSGLAKVRVTIARAESPLSITAWADLP